MKFCSQIQHWFVSLKNKVVRQQLKLTEEEIEKLRGESYKLGRQDALKEIDDVLKWKPNEDQIDTLRHVCYLAIGKPGFTPLFTLYRQLRKQYVLQNG